MKEIPEDKHHDFMNCINALGLLTGSRRWALDTPESDYDVVLTIDAFEAISFRIGLLLDEVGEKGGYADEVMFQNGTGFESFKYNIRISWTGRHDRDVVVNLLVVSRRGYMIWQKATEMMDELTDVNREKYRDKEARVKKFETLKAVAEMELYQP